MNENYKEKFFDLRRLIGLLLTIYGVIIGGYGLFYHPQVPGISFNIDLLWGILILIVGVLFLLMSLRAPRVDNEDGE